ncbi:ECF transporter S component [Lentilactobacillus kosonis]|uniref:Substrate-specific component PdxU2 of predicted pyridoxin-related ECF transporter n=1 Tax=Lentilactobacillus kosonis TaxID=2810561 RepID=A0A401FJE9_9LACO|nr:ECF transporter S component [Lentilactobacillus kosonis]GAY72520.1 substrate-specific component PdxU2 of predicted pyridoxin-related ECF transporter [Lentilactobacillus kosonis]
MENNQTLGTKRIKELSLSSVLVAVTVVISRVFIIPVPLTHGYINLCDAGIFVAALLLGPKLGGLVGGTTGFLLDLLAGYGQYMIFSLIVHGLEGFLVGLVAKQNSNHTVVKIGAMSVGILVMVGGYFIADTILYTAATGFIGIPMNIVQGIVGMVVSMMIYPLLKRRI